MTLPQFTKFYETPEHAAAAVRHYRWIGRHAKPLRQPALVVVGPRSLTFERVEGHSVGPEDLPRMAELLGHAHGAAWRSDLQSASLGAPHHFEDGTTFDDYLGPRKIALRRRHEQGYLPGKASLDAMLGLLEETAQGPTAFYKDSNPRNFIITGAGEVVTVDTDDLSLAPMGYDLAALQHVLFRRKVPQALTAQTGTAVASRSCAPSPKGLLGSINKKISALRDAIAVVESTTPQTMDTELILDMAQGLPPPAPRPPPEIPPQHRGTTAPPPQGRQPKPPRPRTPPPPLEDTGGNSRVAGRVCSDLDLLQGPGEHAVQGAAAEPRVDRLP